jgi:YVTN family beta-propeller protein
LLYVVCQDSDEVRVIEALSGKIVGTIGVGHVPRGIALSPDGHTLYVTNAWSDSVSEVDTNTLQMVRGLPTGFEPTGIALDSKHDALYVANRLSNDVSVIDLKSGQERKRLLAGRGASYLAVSPDGKLIYCSHIYPNPGAFRSPPNSEITVIDTERQTVIERKALNNVAGLFHIAISSDGKLGAVAQLRPKNLIPLAHVEHGSVFGDSLTLFGSDPGGMVQIPVGSGDSAKQVKDISFYSRIGECDHHSRPAASGRDSVTPAAVRERSICLSRVRVRQSCSWAQSARPGTVPRRRPLICCQSFG